MRGVRTKRIKDFEDFAFELLGFRVNILCTAYPTQSGIATWEPNEPWYSYQIHTNKKP